MLGRIVKQRCITACPPFIVRSVASVLNNDRIYIMGPGEYLEPGLFILDPWGFIMYY
jgi:hypothetical protein